MNTKRYIGIASRILVGLVFVASAVTKFLSLDAVDMFVFEHKLFSWDVTQFLVRLLIAIEAGLGLSLIAGLCQKSIRWVTVGFLAAFTLYVLAKPLLFDVSSDNCHCFGTVYLLSDTQTIVKNIILLALCVPMFWQEGLKRRWTKWLLAGFFVASTATVFIMKAPDTIICKLYDKSASLDKAKFDELLSSEQVAATDVTKGRKVLCLYSTGCKHCKRTAKKIDVMIARHSLGKSSFVVLFWGNEQNIAKFYRETEVQHLSSTLVSPVAFLSATKGRQPIIVLLEDGKIVNVFKSVNLDENEIIRFLK